MGSRGRPTGSQEVRGRPAGAHGVTGWAYKYRVPGSQGVVLQGPVQEGQPRRSTGKFNGPSDDLKVI